MKTVRSISTVVLFLSYPGRSCCGLYAPSQADDRSHGHPDPACSWRDENDSPVEYKVSGSVEGSGYSYSVSVLNRNVWPYNNCSARAKKEASFEGVYGESIAGSGTKTFSHEGFVPGEYYEAKGEYFVCAWVEAYGEVHAQNTTVIQVTESTQEAVTKEEAKATAEREAEKEAKRKVTEENQAKVQAEEKAAAERKTKEAETALLAPVVIPAPAPPTIAPVAPVKATVVTPVVKPVSKLAKALKLCKKLKKHSKRVACEKRAKNKYKR
jgi:hypothetical protein